MAGAMACTLAARAGHCTGCAVARSAILPNWTVRAPTGSATFSPRCRCLQQSNPQPELITAVTGAVRPVVDGSLAIGVKAAARRAEHALFREAILFR